MKRDLIFVLILILFVIPLISAVEVDMKTNLSQEETLMAKVSGYFLEPILEENIFFYRGHVRVPMVYDVAEINDEFYIYALIGDKEPQNYSLVIKDARYMKGSQVSEEDIVKNFSITDNTADFSIEPGFVVTNEDFFIEVQNLQDYEIAIKTEIKNKAENTFENWFKDGNESEVSLLSGEKKKINFNVEEMNQFSVIKLSTENLVYEIPAYVFTEASSKGEKGFNLEPSELNISLPTNYEATRILYLYNTGNEDLENISLFVSDSLKNYINLSIENIEELDKDSNIKIEFYLFSEDEKEIEGSIKAKTEDDLLITYSEILLSFVDDYVPLEEEDEITVTKTCAELNGMICDKQEKCDGTSVNAKNSVCCLGNCKEIKKSSAGTIIGWIIVVLIVGFIVWFFLKKYRKVKKPINLLEIARGKNPRNFNPPEIKRVERPIERVVHRPVTRIIERPIIRNINRPIIKKEEPKPLVPKYVGSSKAKTYHKSSCKFSKLIDNKYKISKDDVEYFQKNGYKPCKVCMK